MWIELPWPENPVNTYAWHTETLDSCFYLIRSQSSVSTVISTTGDQSSDHRLQSRNSTTVPSIHIAHKLTSHGNYHCCILPFNPAKHAIPKWCTWRKWHIHDGSYEKKSRRWAWLKKWDKVNSHGTLIDWYIGREWPVNCMTVISVWWWSNMLFQRLSGQLNYYIAWRRQEVSELEIR